MSIDQISLPKGVGPHATKLLDAITGASTHEELNRAGGKAEGFVLGLEAAKAIKSQIAESGVGWQAGQCVLSGRAVFPQS